MPPFMPTWNGPMPPPPPPPHMFTHRHPAPPPPAFRHGQQPHQQRRQNGPVVRPPNKLQMSEEERKQAFVPLQVRFLVFFRGGTVSVLFRFGLAFEICRIFRIFGFCRHGKFGFFSEFAGFANGFSRRHCFAASQVIRQKASSRTGDSSGPSSTQATPQKPDENVVTTDGVSPPGNSDTAASDKPVEPKPKAVQAPRPTSSRSSRRRLAINLG